MVIILVFIDKYPILQVFLLAVLMTAFTIFLTHFRPFYNKVHLRLAIFNQTCILICLFLSFIIYIWLSVTLSYPSEMYILYSLGLCSVFLVFLSTIIGYPMMHVYLIVKQTCPAFKRKAKKAVDDREELK